MKNRIKELRLKRNLSQEEFSKICEVSRPLISKLENQKMKDVSFSIMRKISKGLNKKVEEVFFLNKL